MNTSHPISLYYRDQIYPSCYQLKGNEYLHTNSLYDSTTTAISITAGLML